jgi:DNA-binding NarL/FixJ family response regulator
MAITVSIIDAQPERRQKFSTWLNRAQRFHCVSTYERLADARLDFQHSGPDIVLLDLSLSQRDGLASVADLHADLPATQIVALLDREKVDDLIEAMAHGVCAYVPRSTSPLPFLRLLEEVASGSSPVSGQVGRRLIELLQQRKPARPANPALSQREREIMSLLARGHPYKEIAGLLAISINTVRTHVRRVYAKLKVPCRMHAVLKWRDEWNPEGHPASAQGPAAPLPKSAVLPA